ncbi:MAG: tripartite tricarboxylate transporter substrate binding protein [Pseudomonadota bacterium]
MNTTRPSALPRRALTAAVAAAACLALPLAALAQGSSSTNGWPNKPIRVVVPYVPGGPMDYLGRALAQKLQPVFGQPLVLDNRAGAGGAIGSEFVAKSAPDGYTMLLTSSSLATLPTIMKNAGYDTLKDFAPITMVADSVGFILIANKNAPFKSVKELVAFEKSKPGSVNYGSAGNGNVMHFAAESFNSAAGTKMTHVPYKGSAQAINDLIGGQIQVSFVPPNVAIPFIKAGTVNALGIAAPKRWDVLPDVPTIDESGLKGFKYGPYYGLWFPAGTPRPIVNRMRAEVVKALADPEVAKGFAEQGFVPVGSSPSEFTKTNEKEVEFNRQLVARIGLKPE